MNWNIADTSVISGLLALVMSASAVAQAQAPPTEFTMTAFTLPFRVPGSTVVDGRTPVITGSVAWVAIKNETTIPYNLCTPLRGWAIGGAVTGGGASHCGPYWILLPGETHFEQMIVPIPAEPLATMLLSVTLAGNPLGLSENGARWTLMWQGTVGEARAAGEKVRAIGRP
jgi:hypothetical protein